MDSAFTNLAPHASIIGLYFSADYCKYCKDFTPLLIDLYPQLLANNIDIILVSSDKQIDKYDAYRFTHPWSSLPFDINKELSAALRSEYNIITIPSLLFFDSIHGTLITANGRNMICDDRSQLIKYLTESIIMQYDSDEEF